MNTRSLPQISPEAGLASVLTSEFGDAFSGAVAALTDQPQTFDPDGIDPSYFKRHDYEQLSRGF